MLSSEGCVLNAVKEVYTRSLGHAFLTSLIPSLFMYNTTRKGFFSLIAPMSYGMVTLRL